MAATLKKKLTDSLDNLSAHQRLKTLSLRLKNPNMKIPETDYACVGAFILKIVDELPDVLSDKKNRSLENLLIYCISHPGVIDEINKLLAKEQKSLKEKAEILAELYPQRTSSLKSTR